MNQLKENWKTAALGIFTSAMYVAATTYTTGMNWRQWGVAAGLAVLGLLAKDFNVKPS